MTLPDNSPPTGTARWSRPPTRTGWPPVPAIRNPTAGSRPTLGDNPPRVSVGLGTLAAMLVTRAGLSPVMVGRDPELAQLRRLAADSTTPTIVLIGGEPGIGKTRLAAELVQTVRPGTRLLLGQADPGGLTQPYQLLLDLAGDHPEPAAAVRDSGDPIARGRAALALLRELVGTGPAVLVVDDLHWADPETLAAFEQLDEVTTGPLLLLGTYRPGELSRRHPLAGTLERLDRRHGVTHLRLERLAPADTARFLAAVYGRAPARRVVTALHHRTGGNPFFLEELLKAAGEADLSEIHTQPLPWNLAEALRSQLDGLAPDRRQVVEAAAVLGARVSFDLLAAVTGLHEPAMLAALRDLVDRELLVEAEDDQFGFRQTLTREVVTGELLGRQRRRLHEAALEALVAAPAPDLAAVAVHARGAGRYPDMVAAARRGAADRLAAGSAYAALTLAELALAEVPDDHELLVLAGTAAWRAGYPADAEQHVRRALRAATDDAQRVAALTELIRVAWEQADLSEVDSHTERVRELAERLPDGEVQARALTAVARSYMLRHGPGDPVEWAERACAAAERHGLKEVRLAALVEKGSALVTGDGDSAEGRRLLTEVAAEAEHAGAHLEAARGWHNLFWCLPPGDPAGPELLERMRASADRAGVAGMALGAYHQGRAWLAQLAGDLDAAIAVLEQARRMDRNATAVDPASGAPIALHLDLSSGLHLRGRLAELYLERGDLAAVQALLAESSSSRKWQQAAVGLAFQLACRRGDQATARKLLAKLVGIDAKLQNAPARHCQLAAGIAAGLPVESLRPLAEPPASQRPASHRRNGRRRKDEPWQRLLSAQLAEVEGRYAEALAGYQWIAATGADDHDRDASPVPPAHRGSAAVGAARCLIQLGRPAEAGHHLAAAQRLLARWPGWRRAELAAVTRRLGPAPGAGGPGPAGDLTPREREVAGLLAEGLTNSEIARRLVISRKTVAVHVSHILAKLEMSSRTQVAAWVARDGLGTATR
jgi:DNA-binding CsgD family transcriptional regulator/tetratricopeptide (TPR) repeat protein